MYVGSLLTLSVLTHGFINSDSQGRVQERNGGRGEEKVKGRRKEREEKRKGGGGRNIREGAPTLCACGQYLTLLVIHTNLAILIVRGESRKEIKRGESKGYKGEEKREGKRQGQRGLQHYVHVGSVKML